MATGSLTITVTPLGAATPDSLAAAAAAPLAPFVAKYSTAIRRGMPTPSPTPRPMAMLLLLGVEVAGVDDATATVTEG